jgi:hypothetical protein
VQALGLLTGSQGLPTPQREPAHETSRSANTQQREPGETVLALLAAVPFGVILILFLVALLRCQRADIPAVMEALAGVLKALTRWGGGG